MPRGDSGLLHETRNFTGTPGNVFERPLATFFNSKNLASSSQEFRSDITRTTKRPESQKRREPLNTSIPLPHFQKGGGMLNHNWWNLFSQWYDGQSEISDFRNCIWEKFLTLWNFKARKSTLRLKFVRKTAYPRLTMHWIKEVEMAKPNDELMASRSNVGRTDFTDFDMVDVTIASALNRLLDRHIHFRKRVSKSSVLQNTTDSCEEDKLLT